MNGNILFEQEVKEMRSLAKHLLPYSFPITSPEDEDAISCLKQRDVNVDGYDLVIYFNNCSYGEVTLETLQIFGKHISFLPFSLICKCAYKFLGSQELSLIEVMHFKTPNTFDDNCRKIYVWTVYYNKEGKPVASPFAKEQKIRSYEGLQFSQLNRNEVMFF